MKSFIIVAVLLSCCMLHGQVLDTIYANDQKNVALFFPSPIRQGITGTDHFVFTYNREKEQYFGLLQAKPGIESNLLTITRDGQVYSYILKYAKVLSKLNYFIEASESIGTEKPQTKEIVSEVLGHSNRVNRVTYFQKFSEYLLESKFEKLANVRKKGMKFRLQKMLYNRSEVYLVLEIENGSGVDFEVDFVKVYNVSGNRKRKASFQELEKEVVYVHWVPSVVVNGTSKQFVLVLPKFVLGTNEKLRIELKELKGNRQLSLNYKR